MAISPSGAFVPVHRPSSILTWNPWDWLQREDGGGFWALIQITMSAVPQGGRTLFCLGSWRCPLHDQWRVFKAPSSGSFSSCYQPRRHGLVKTAQTGHCFSVITHPPLSVQGLGTQVDPGKANCLDWSGRLLQREKSGQT